MIFQLQVSRLLMTMLFSIVLLITPGCSQNQDEVNLPIYDSVGGNFTLPSTLGKDVSLSDFRGKVVLLNFGYTQCPDICPMVLNHLSKLSEKLSNKYGIKPELLQTIFVSVDPDRDTIEHLTEYLAFFPGEFLW